MPETTIMGLFCSWLRRKADEHRDVLRNGDEVCGFCGHVLIDHWGPAEQCRGGGRGSCEKDCSRFVTSGRLKHEGDAS